MFLFHGVFDVYSSAKQAPYRVDKVSKAIFKSLMEHLNAYTICTHIITYGTYVTACWLVILLLSEIDGKSKKWKRGHIREK